MVPMSFPSRSRFQLGPGFGLDIGSSSVPRLEVECCARNHIRLSSECHHTFPEIRELPLQMGSSSHQMSANKQHKNHLKCDDARITKKEMRAWYHCAACFFRDQTTHNHSHPYTRTYAHSTSKPQSLTNYIPPPPPPGPGQ